MHNIPPLNTHKQQDRELDQYCLLMAFVNNKQVSNKQPEYS